MASKKKMNKAQLIIDALAKNPKATPIEIAEKLKAHKVTAAYVSNVKSTKRASKGKVTKKTKGVRSTKRVASDNVSMSSLVKAKQLADELGGVERAKQMLDALAKLTG